MDYLKTRELYHAFGDWGKRRKKNNVEIIPVFDKNGVLQQPTRTSLETPTAAKTPDRNRAVSGKANLSGIGSDQPMLDENSKFASKLSAERKEVRSRNEWIAKSAECTTRINTLTARRDTNPGAKSATFNPVIVAMRNAKGHCDEMAKSYADDINARTKADLEKARSKVNRLNQVGEANVNRKLAEEKKKRRQDTIRKFFRHSAMNSNDYTAVRELYHSKFKYIDKYKSKAGNWVYIYEDAKDKVKNAIDDAAFEVGWQADKVKNKAKDAAGDVGWAVDSAATYVNRNVTGKEYKQMADYHDNQAKYHKESHDYDKRQSKMFTEFAKEKGNDHADCDRQWAANRATTASKHSYLSTQHKKAAEKAKDDYLNKSLAGKAATATRNARQKFDKNYTENYNEWRDRVTKNKSKTTLKSKEYYDEDRDRFNKKIRVK